MGNSTRRDGTAAPMAWAGAAGPIAPAGDEELAQLFAVSLDLMAVVGADGYLRRVNPAWERTFGHSTPELMARPYLEFVHPDDRHTVATQMARAATGLSADLRTIRLLPADGSLRLVEWSSVPRHDGRLIYVVGRDVTDRARAETALRASEERLRNLLEVSPNAFLVVDATGRILSADGRVEEILGYLPADLVGQSVEVLVPAGLRTLHARQRAGYDADPHPRPMARGAFMARHAGGTDVAVDIGLSPITVDDAACVLATIVDATDRRQIEVALRASEHTLAKAQRIARLGSWTLDPASGNATWSHEMYRILGRDPDGPAIGLAELASFLSPDSVARVSDAIERTVRTGTPWQMDLEIVRPDGSRGWVSSRGEVERDAVGAMTGIHGTMLDISDRVSAEQERSRLVSAIEHSGDAIMISQIDGPIEYVNRSFSRLYGYTPAEVLGQNLRILKSGRHTREFWEEAWDRIRAGETWSAFIVNRRRDGTLVEVETVMAPFRDAMGQLAGLVKADRDVTRERMLEDQLRQAAKMEAIGQLAGGVAHDFNNMLTAIRGYTELVRSDLPAAYTQSREDLDQVMIAADRAAELTRQLLAFSRKQLLEPRVLDPAERVTGIAPMLRRLLGEHIELTVAHQPDGGHVLLDPVQLEQVILNLAVNARDAMPGGGKLTIETSDVAIDDAYAASHTDARPGPHVLLAISDTGTGMDEATLTHIFEPFFTTKEPGKGTGMGLATVYGIVRQSGGAINVYSEPGHGTTFRIYFPRVLDAGADQAPTSRPGSPRSPAGETVLLVEDEPAVRGFAHRTLTDLGYEVLDAARGGEALAIASAYRGRIALLVTDVIMPGMQGPELADRLAAARPGLRTLFVSGFTEHAPVHHGVGGAAGSYLAKPFNAETLARAVRDVIEADA